METNYLVSLCTDITILRYAFYCCLRRSKEYRFGRKVHKLSEDRVSQTLDVRNLMRQQGTLSVLIRHIFPEQKHRRWLKLQRKGRVLRPKSRESSSSSADSVTFFDSEDDEKSLKLMLKTCINPRKAADPLESPRSLKLLNGVYPKSQQQDKSHNSQTNREVGPFEEEEVSMSDIRASRI